MVSRIKRSLSVIATLALSVIIISSAPSAFAQATAPASDSTMVFEPVQPLIQTEEQQLQMYPNTWGFDASFSDYGFGGGLYYNHRYSTDFTAGVSVDLGTAKGARELGDEQSKINRIFVIPVMLNGQYRLFSQSLTENLRPYVTAGAGPVIVMTTPFSQEYFSAFGSAQAKAVPGGFVGAGANFGVDRKTSFGASIRYFIIPYPGSVQSTSTQSLTDLSGLFLTVSYGFKF
jgi:outer membrane protein W